MHLCVAIWQRKDSEMHSYTENDKTEKLHISF